MERAFVLIVNLLGLVSEMSVRDYTTNIILIGFCQLFFNCYKVLCQKTLSRIGGVFFVC